jgi:uncharacterized protein (UPF0332 family)
VGWLHRSSTTRYWCDSAAQWTPRSATGSSGSCCSVRARGEAGEDSDYDIAVFLRGFTERWPEVDRLVEIETDLLYQIGAFRACVAVRSGRLAGAVATDGRTSPRRRGSVTPEAGRYLAKARQCLAHSEANLAIALGDDAGRAAYLAVFHAAQALMNVRTGREAKTHRGVHVQFARLTNDDARFGTELRRFLAQAYDLKTLADYATGPEAAVPLDRAAAALATAHRFVDVVAYVTGRRYAARRKLKLRPPSDVLTNPMRSSAPSTEAIFGSTRRPHG